MKNEIHICLSDSDHARATITMVNTPTFMQQMANKITLDTRTSYYMSSQITPISTGTLTQKIDI